MSDIAFSAAMDSSAVEKAYAQIIKENAKLREEMSKLATQSRQSADKDREYKKLQSEANKKQLAEQEKLMAAGRRLREQNRTDFERYKQEKSEAQRLLSAGVIKEEEYRRELQRLAKTYKDITPQAKARAAALKDEASAAKSAGSELNAASPKAASFTQRMTEVAAGVSAANMAMKAGQAVIATLREEYDRLIQRQERAAGAQIPLAAVQESALGNLDQSMTAADFLKRMRDTSNQLGMSEADLTAAAASALSAKGDKSASDAISAVVAAARLKRFGSAEEKAGLAGTALDLGKSFGMSPEEALGFLSGAQKTARVVSAKGMAENIAPGIINAGKFGLDRNTSAAIAASLSGGSTDVTGAQTKTTMSSLLEQLEKFAAGDGTPEKYHARQALSVVQMSASAREDFLAGASFEKAMIPAVRELLTPGTQGFREFQNARANMEAIDPGKAYQEELAKKDQSTAIRIATADQLFANATEQVALADSRAAMSGVIRKNLAELDAQTGLRFGYQDRFASMMRDFTGQGMQDLPAARAAVSQMAQQMSGRRQQTRGWGELLLDQVNPISGGSFANSAGATREATAEERDQAKILMNLERMLSLMERQMEQQAGNRQAGAAAARRTKQGEAGP